MRIRVFGLIAQKSKQVQKVLANFIATIVALDAINLFKLL